MTKVYAIQHRSFVGDHTTETHVSSLKKAFDYITTFGEIAIIHDLTTNKWYYKKYFTSTTWQKIFINAKRHPDNLHFKTDKGEWYRIKTIQVF